MGMEVDMNGCVMEGVAPEDMAARFDRLYGDIRKNIDTYGFQVMGIGGDGTGPGFSYTIGLVERGFPEMIVFALPPQFAHAMFTTAVERWAENGVPKDGDVDTEIANLPTAWRDLPAQKTFDDYLIQQRRYYESRHARTIIATNRAVQMVWPDEDGRFPWQPGVAEKCVRLQSGIINLGVTH